MQKKKNTKENFLKNVEKSIILTHTMYFLAIVTNIPQRHKTGFVLQGYNYEVHEREKMNQY